ncbi:efflux RND transporter periplasmic adaptor subunit [Desulforhopalus sp. IMCC35007]|uniref:efflux RND transporter periplasmic adaptor subunit n=1 Tax=Desulforhopalus sp. IMCC35007 TaxID=2569543 RepID=UPI0010ADCC08|nr:efflux RND transporter periplasmic adaptor subunit [Desulforhopalus sp. IMCC35007]TKB12103.1 efflux RND transporter periplasmic adaptor subunit [Desulforhopalus sp. IMCC35007]
MSSNPAPTGDTPVKASTGRTLLQILLAIIVIVGAAALASYYIKTPPKAKPRERMPIAPLVTARSISPQDIIYEFDAMGTVGSAREVQLSPQVSGEVIRMSPDMVPGGYFKKGDHLVSIDPTDYEITILQLKSDLEKAYSDLVLEMGNQRIAVKEFEILGQKVSDTEKKLMLREPQLGIAKANVENAKAKLKKAEIDLARTEVTAPFNGVILSRSVNIGSRVSSGSPLAQIAGTDQFWIKVSVPVSQLQWLNIPGTTSDTGSSALIFLENKNKSTAQRAGRVIRLAADLETEGRMAVLYVAVNDPLALTPENSQQPKLLLGSFVQVIFQGRKLNDVYVIDRNHLHENDTLWLFSTENTLEIRPVDVLARTRDKVYISSNLEPGSLLITSQLSNAANGMPLQLPGNNTTPKNPPKSAMEKTQ